MRCPRPDHNMHGNAIYDHNWTAMAPPSLQNSSQHSTNRIWPTAKVTPLSFEGDNRSIATAPRPLRRTYPTHNNTFCTSAVADCIALRCSTAFAVAPRASSTFSALALFAWHPANIRPFLFFVGGSGWWRRRHSMTGPIHGDPAGDSRIYSTREWVNNNTWTDTCNVLLKERINNIRHMIRHGATKPVRNLIVHLSCAQPSKRSRCPRCDDPQPMVNLIATHRILG